MKKLNIFLAICLALCLLSAPFASVYAGGWNLAGIGSKGLAMAGAYHGIADDWSAMYWNPAGLAGQKMGLGLEVKALIPVVTLTPNASADAFGYVGYHNGIESETEAATYPTGSFGLVYPINQKFTAGLSVFTPSGLGADWKGLFTGPPAGYGNTDAYPEIAWSSDIKVIDIHPTIAYQFNDMVSVGLGLAIQWSSITLQTPKLVPSGDPPIPVPGLEQLFVDATLEGTGMGYGFNVGLMLKPVDKMRLGLSYRGPVTLAIEGTAKQTLYMPTFAPAGLTGNALTAEPDGTADFPVPMDFGLGIAYDALDNLVVAFDILWTQWGSVDKIDLKLDGTDPMGAPAKNSVMQMKYEDTIKFSIGLDYLVNQKFDVRAGYYYDPTPVPDGTLRPTITDVADKQNISLGFAYLLKDNLKIEGYWEYMFTGTKTIVTEDVNADGEFDNVGGDWKLAVNTFGLSLGYAF